MTRRTMRSRIRRFQARADRAMAPGLRLPAGLLLICGGLLGFLPVLGFWMLPLGVALVALDVRAVRRGLARRRALRSRSRSSAPAPGPDPQDPPPPR